MPPFQIVFAHAPAISTIEHRLGGVPLGSADHVRFHRTGFGVEATGLKSWSVRGTACRDAYDGIGYLFGALDESLFAQVGSVRGSAAVFQRVTSGETQDAFQHAIEV